MQLHVYPLIWVFVSVYLTVVPGKLEVMALYPAIRVEYGALATVGLASQSDSHSTSSTMIREAIPLPRAT